MTPFTQDRERSIAALTEKELIAHIREWLGTVCPPYPEGIGDDAAVLEGVPAPLKELISTDSLVWGIHCDETAQPAQIGSKLIQRNISDLAAMGGTPTSAVIALLMGKDVSTHWLELFYSGVKRAAAAHGLRIVGGDITGAPKSFFAANLTVLGYADKPALRHTGRPGDTLWVTGALGGSILGRHLNFKARVDAGRWLAHYGSLTAMTDISDGIMSDLEEFTSPLIQAILDLEAIPIHPDANILAAQTGQSAIHHAISDGEDYELLFALEANKAADFLRDWKEAFPFLPVTCIGKLVTATDPQASRILDLNGQAIADLAYDSIREAP